MARQIGTVELLRARCYPRDWDDPSAGEVVVEPGTYPLFREHDVIGDDDVQDAYWWVMPANVNDGGGVDISPMWRDEHGATFSMQRKPDKIGEPVGEFRSKVFTLPEFAELRGHETATEGHPEQRLRITVDS